MIADDYIIDRQIGKLISGNYNKDQLEYKIQQLTKDNVLVEEHNCVTEFEICREDIKKQAHISECINGKRKSAYGFVWRRVINKAK